MPSAAKPTKYLNRFFSGLYTQRSPLSTPFSFAGVVHIIEKDDALLDGLNIEQTASLVYQRRPGYSPWITLNAGEVVRNGYTWRKLDGTLDNLLDCTTTIGYVAGGGSSKTTLVTLNGGEGTSWFLGVGARLYFATGSRASKWDGTTVTNWGIVGPVTNPGIVVGSGPLNPKTGYQYVYCFRNSSTGHISNASPISGNTGPQSAANFTITGGTTSDAQVDTVEIYRTVDGGGVFYKLADVTYSSSWSYTDTLADTALNTSLQAPLSAQNTPPPAGFTQPAWHMGLVWGIVGNTVYFSGGDTVTNGVPEECFPPLNFFTFPGPVKQLVPTSAGLQVWMQDGTYLVVGVDPTSFSPQPWMAGIGIASPFALAVDSGTVYAFTNKRQLLSFDTSSTDVGFPISDLLGGIAPASATLAVHRASSQDAALYLADGAGNIWRYSLILSSWATKATPVYAPNWIGSLETSPGVWNLVLAPTSSSDPVLLRNTTLYTDNGTAYDAWFTLGSLVLAPPGQLVTVPYLCATFDNASVAPTVSVLSNEISGTFVAIPNPVPDPPEFPAAASITNSRYYVSTSDVPGLLRHFQLQVDFGTNSSATSILELAITTDAPALSAPPGVF